MANPGSLRPPWTPETAPRGGRPKGARDRIAQRIAEATAAFIEGEFDLAAWLLTLSQSEAPPDRATLARFLGQFIPKDINLSGDVTMTPAVADALMDLHRARAAAVAERASALNGNGHHAG